MGRTRSRFSRHCVNHRDRAFLVDGFTGLAALMGMPSRKHYKQGRHAQNSRAVRLLATVLTALVGCSTSSADLDAGGAGTPRPDGSVSQDRAPNAGGRAMAGVGGMSGGARAGNAAPGGAAQGGSPARTAGDAGVADSGKSDDADAGSVAAGPRVRIASGSVEGTIEGTTRVFFGIPYAKPVTGTRRFKAPEPAEAWPDVLAAKTPRAMCPQPTQPQGKVVPGTHPAPQNEDCLQLNVFTPDEPSAKGGLPVMVFVHGGSSMVGSATDYDAHELSEAGKVVVVTINYRLGALGGLRLPELDQYLGHASGNLALRDQQLALHWIRDNAAAFGGDPRNVTLFGESAGSAFSCFHLFAPASRGLFDRVIMESAVCVGTDGPLAMKTQDALTTASRHLADNLCAGASDVVQCLQGVPADMLAKYTPSDTSEMTVNGVFPSYVDGDVFVETPDASLAQGRIARVPIMLGSNAHEVAFLKSDLYGDVWPPFKDWTLLAVFEVLVPGVFETYGTSVLGLPLLSADKVNDLGVQFMTDYLYRCPTRKFARQLSHLGLNVHLYSFEVSPAVHALELDYVFGWPEGHYSQLYADAPQPPLRSTIASMQSYWTSFARNSEPMGPTSWPAYTEANDAHLVLAESAVAGTGLARATCDVVDKAAPKP
jgi:para-nitrobenzyl esterase